jgi:hypothetical protein
MTIEIKATPVKAYELKPGDLFSTRGADYWSMFSWKGGLGEQVYIRTDVPADSSPDADSIIYKIEVIK